MWEGHFSILRLHDKPVLDSYNVDQQPALDSYHADQDVQRLQKLFTDDTERHKVAETERAEEQIRLVQRECERSKKVQLEAEVHIEQNRTKQDNVF